MAMTSRCRTGWAIILCLLLIVPLTRTQIYEGQCELDLIFLVDSGSSTGNGNFRNLLNSILRYVEDLFVAPEAVHVGLISFSSTSDVVHLTDSLDEFTTGVNNLPYRGRMTYTHTAFQWALTDFMSSPRAAYVAKTAILFTDDAASVSNLAEEAAEDLRLFDVDLWCVGIGTRVSRFYQELFAFTGEDIDRVILTRDYGVVPAAIDLPLACEVYYPPDPPTTTSVLEVTSSTQNDSIKTSQGVIQGSSALTVSEMIATTNTGNLNTDFMITTRIEIIATSDTFADSTTHLTGYQPTAKSDEARTETATVKEGFDTTNTINNQKTVSLIIQPTATLDVGHTERATINVGMETTNIPSNRRTDETINQVTPSMDVGHTEAATVDEGMDTTHTSNIHRSDHPFVRPTATQDLRHTTENGTRDISPTDDLRPTPTHPTATQDVRHTTENGTRDISPTDDLRSIPSHPTATQDARHTTENGTRDVTPTDSLRATPIHPTATQDARHTTENGTRDISPTGNLRPTPTHPTATQDLRHTTESGTRDISPTDDLRTTPTQTPPLPTGAYTMLYSSSNYMPPFDSTTVTSEPPPSSTPDPILDKISPDLLCSKAQDVDGLWLTSHPTDCDKFVQCHYENEGRLTTAVRLCPRGLFWSKANSTCVEPKEADCSMDPCRDREVDTYNMDGGCGLYWRCLGRVSHGESCKRGYAYTSLEGCIPSPRCRTFSISDESCENEGPCQRMPLPGNRAFQTKLQAFPGEWMTTPCLYGATFDMASCSCLNSRPFASDCQHIVKIERQNETHGERGSTSLIFDPSSSRPTALRFRYKPSLSNDDYNERREILMRSSECSVGGLFVLWEEDEFLETRIFARNGYFLKSSLPLLGLNNTEWRTVDLRFTFSGDLSVKLKSGPLTFTSYIQGGLYIPLSLCGWDAGLPGSLADQVSPFHGDIEEIYISRCYDHGF